MVVSFTPELSSSFTYTRVRDTMTLYYDEETGNIVENNPGDWIGYDVSGKFVMDFDEASDRRKVVHLLRAVEGAIEDSDHHELVEEAEVIVDMSEASE